MRYLVTIAVALALASCSMGQDIGTTGKAVDTFHAQLNAGQFSAILNASGPEVKNDSQAMLTLLQQAHDRLGAVKSSTRTGFNDNINNGVHTVSLTYSTVFERGQGTENFLFRLNGGTVQMIGYQINAPASSGT
jgi:hypothetical protein